MLSLSEKDFKINNEKQLNEWEIAKCDLNVFKDKKLGEGKFGEVFLATWKGTTVAAKIMSEKIIPDKKKFFYNEYENLTKLHHPNIIQLFGYVENPFIIVMEYLSNKDLLSYLNKNLNFKKKINICLDMLKGLEYLHTRQPKYIIHRDIKIQNILIDSSGRAKIADFGLSRDFNNLPGLTCTYFKRTLSNEDLTTPIGTKRYMAPEITNNDKYNYKIDIWSLGIIFAELFENKRYNSNFFWHKTPSKIKNIIIDKMLQKEPKNRSNCNELIILLNDELQNLNNNGCLCNIL